MTDPTTYHGRTLSNAILIRWPDAARTSYGFQPPREAFYDGSYSEFRRDWFAAQGARFMASSGAKGKRTWYVRADVVGASGDFNLDDKRGRLRTFATREAAQAEADKLNALSAPFRIPLAQAIAEARPAFLSGMKAHRSRGLRWAVQAIGQARAVEAGDRLAAWGSGLARTSGVRLISIVMESDFRAGVRLAAALDARA